MGTRPNELGRWVRSMVANLSSELYDAYKLHIPSPHHVTFASAFPINASSESFPLRHHLNFSTNTLSEAFPLIRQLNV